MLFPLTMLIVSLAFIGIACGVMFGRRPLQGSCGGLAQGRTDADYNMVCSVCGQSAGSCENDEIKPHFLNLEMKRNS